MKLPATRQLLLALTVVVSVAGVASAQNARPLRFWVTVLDVSGQNSRAPGSNFDSYLVRRDVPSTFAPGALAGWTCVATAPTFAEMPGFASKDGRPYMVQRAMLKCTTAGGSVNVRVACNVSTQDQAAHESAVIEDASGHEAMVTLRCEN